MNSQEAKKSGDQIASVARIRWAGKERFITLQDAKKVVKVVQKCPN